MNNIINFPYSDPHTGLVLGHMNITNKYNGGFDTSDKVKSFGFQEQAKTLINKKRKKAVVKEINKLCKTFSWMPKGI